MTDSQGREGDSPLIGDNVEFGAHAVVIGAVTLGDNVKVGAGTVVTKDLYRRNDCRRSTLSGIKRCLARVCLGRKPALVETRVLLRAG